MNLDINEQELEDLKQVIYEKMKALDREIERQKRLADRLEAFYERLNTDK